MLNRDWERLGQDIQRTVQSAVETGDFTRLNQAINSTINQKVNTVAWNIRSFGEKMGQKQEYAYQKVPSPEVLYDSGAGKSTGSVLMTVFGSILLVFSSVGVIGGSLVKWLIALEGVPIQLWMGISMMVLILSVIMTIVGSKRTGQHRRFKEYIRVLGGREYCNLDELEKRIKKSHKFVVKDIKKMFEKGWFRQGHLDEQCTCLMVTDRMYEQYRQVEERRKAYVAEQKFKEEQTEAEKRKQQKEAEERRQSLSPEVRSIIEQGDQYVKRIRACNDAIPGEEISAKISRMELIVDKIFDRVEQNPDSVDDIGKLMEYYLPTTIKLLEAYQEMDVQPIGGENIQTAKAEIEATLDTLNLAFEKLLDSLFLEKAWDVSSDISVLNTMLAQEGLKEDGMRLKK